MGPAGDSSRRSAPLHAVSFTRQQVGVESLTIEFPLTPYRGMGREAGYNALYFWSTVHCWVKNVAIINADMALALDGTHFCTVRQHGRMACLCTRLRTRTSCACLLCQRSWRRRAQACLHAHCRGLCPQVDGLQLSSGGRGVNNGLWGIWLKNGADNLVRGFRAGARLIRGIAVQGLQPGTVIANSAPHV